MQQKKKVNAAELEQNSAAWQQKSMQIRANTAVQREQVAVAKQNHLTSLLTGTDANMWSASKNGGAFSGGMGGNSEMSAGSPVKGRKMSGQKKITHALLSRWEKDLSRSVSRPHSGSKGGGSGGDRLASNPSPTSPTKRTASPSKRPGSAGEAEISRLSGTSMAARPSTSGGLASPVKARKGEFHAPNIPLITLANAADNLAKTTRTALKSWNNSLWTPIHDIIDGSIAIVNFWSFSKETSTVPVDM